MKADQPNKNKEREVAVKRYRDVMKCIIRRYVTAEQKKTEEQTTEEQTIEESSELKDEETTSSEK